MSLACRMQGLQHVCSRVEWTAHLVPQVLKDLDNRLLQVLAETHILDVLLILSTHGVYLHVVLKPVNAMVRQVDGLHFGQHAIK